MPPPDTTASVDSADTVPTVEPTTTLVSDRSVPNEIEVLVALLPRSVEFGAQWLDQGGQTGTDFAGGTGLLVGVCGGANADARAQDAGAWGVANGAEYRSPEGATGYATVYGFPDEAGAAKFLSQTRAASTCTVGGEVAEGSGAGEFDGFAEPGLDGLVRWQVSEAVYWQPAPPVEAGEAIFVVSSIVLQTQHDSIDYSAQFDDVTAVVRIGAVVLVANLSSYCCASGFGAAVGSYAATVDDFSPAVAGVTRWFVETMRSQGFA